jgi:hypothetical protein
MKTTIEQMELRIAKIRSNKDPKVKPGKPERFTEAACVGDCIRQGDLYLVIGNKVQKKGFVLIENPGEKHKQLVPGNTQGSKHCLDSLNGVAIYRPEKFDNESTIGPVLVLSQERVVQHPTHGHVTLCADTIVECHFQREFDLEQKREKRVRD